MESSETEEVGIGLPLFLLFFVVFFPRVGVFTLRSGGKTGWGERGGGGWRGERRMQMKPGVFVSEERPSLTSRLASRGAGPPAGGFFFFFFCPCLPFLALSVSVERALKNKER